jgi:hypothetical protein
MSSSGQDAPSSSIEPPWPAQTGVFATYDLHVRANPVIELWRHLLTVRNVFKCHCGAVRYKITISPPLYEEQTEGKGQYTLGSCDCSHCERHGALVVHPHTKNVVFTHGLEDRVEYRSATKMNPHYICGKCGCFLGTDLTWMMENVFKDESRWTINVSTQGFQYPQLFVLS